MNPQANAVQVIVKPAYCSHTKRIARPSSAPPRNPTNVFSRSFENPITPDEALLNYNYMLNDADYSDIGQFREIYYLHKHEKYEITHNCSFPFIKDDHIAYRYQQLSICGFGTYGAVIRCIDHKNHKKVAIKVIDLEKTDIEQVNHELQYMWRLKNHLDGPHTHHVVEVFDNFEYRGFICIVMTNLHENLYYILKENHFNGFNENTIKMIAEQLADALAFSHSSGVVHSDIKPENIMFTNESMNDVFLIDYGCACLDNNPLYLVVQSLYYRAPEVIFGFRYGTKIDVWSFGCVLYELATGVPLFHCKNEKGLISKITNLIGLPPKEMVSKSEKMQKYFARGVMVNRAAADARKCQKIRSHLKNFDPQFADLICSCLDWLPSRRPSMEQILKHKFFN